MRDDKSPFFKELETQLLQDEVKEDKVEDAYYEYLEKLDEIARLEPVSSYHEKDSDKGIDIVHVVAKTYAQPQHYYYRTLENNQWSAWERMNLEIKGDHVALVVWNRRLHIYWLTFIEKSPSADEISAIKYEIGQRVTLHKYKWKYWIDAIDSILRDDINHDRLKYWEVLLNWSELKDGKWLAPKVSKDTMELKPYKVVLNVRNLQNYSITGFIGSVGSSTYTSSLGYIGSPSALGSLGYPVSDVEDLLRFLTKSKEKRIHQLFRDRLYLLPILSNDSELVLNILFGGGLDEYNIGMHSFICKDSSTDPVVMRNTERGYQFLAPVSTVTNSMHFYQSPLRVGAPGSTGKLSTDGYQWVSAGSVGHYIYAYDALWGGPPLTMPIHTFDQVILNNTPYGPFRLTARSDMMRNRRIDQIEPVEDNFFYEDTCNNFFVRKVATREDSDVFTLLEGQPTLAASGDFYDKTYVRSFAPPDLGFTGSEAKVFDVATRTVQQFDGHLVSKYYFQTFFHPHIHNFIKVLNRDGIDGLLRVNIQEKNDTLAFPSQYQPTSLVIDKDRHLYPTNIVEFKFDGAYSKYNWELFFHIPMLVAQSLSTNQQFSDAQKWYHYIFNPTNNTDETGTISFGKERFWNFRPFYEEAASTTLSASFITSFADQIAAWQANPFQPHLIARMRIVAYMKNVVMKYIDNLIAWGDQLFRRNTIESINEAIQVYILASNILGPRPQEIPSRALAAINNFNELIAAGPLDDFSNTLVKIESFIDPSAFPKTTLTTNPTSTLKMKFFCLANNEKLIGYWDTIADRLFKIRNCMNIEGVGQQLPLFEPPIDPAMLVRAAAAGVDTNSVLNDASGIGIPGYRFSYMLQKANELVADVKSLGSSILSALEKKDAEKLALLRSGQEIDILDQVTFIRESQLNDAKSALEALLKTKENTTLRLQYYSSRPFMNANEQKHLSSLQIGLILQSVQSGVQAAAGALAYVPQFHGQATFAIGASFGGEQLYKGLNAVGAVLGIANIINSTKGSMAATTGAYERRRDDWTFQVDTAKKELEQLDKQIIGAEIRISMAERELSNHLKQIDNSKAVDDYMRQKFTNQELYNWMVSQLAAVYFQSFQLAYDLAAKAEKCYDFELPLAESKKPVGGFIKFGYWDSLRKGLLTGERLQYDLRKIEHSYLEENRRSNELTKHISLAMLDPYELLELRTNKTCTVNLPEWLFDLDYPGQYMRRIKSISLSIPCIAGPYTTISCKLTLLNSKYRKNPTVSANTDAAYKETPVGSDPRFKYLPAGAQSLATSGAQNDSGMFELSFRDERYLPFEGAGAISEWQIDLPAAYAQFDYDSISDVILHVNYTAAESGTLSLAAKDHVRETFENMARDGFMEFFSLRQEFANEWYAYANTFSDTAPTSVTIKLTENRFAFFASGKKIDVAPLYIMLKPKAGLTGDFTLEVSHKVNGVVTNTPFALTSLNNHSLLISLPTTLITIDGNTRIMKLMLKDGNGDHVNMDELLEDIYVVTKNRFSGVVTVPGADDTDWIAPALTTLPTGMSGWWQADAGITTIAGNVDAWADQSGSGNHLTAPSATMRPPFIATGGSNNSPRIVFSGAQSLYVAALSLPVTTDLTTFMVMKNTASSVGLALELTPDVNHSYDGYTVAINAGDADLLTVLHRGNAGYCAKSDYTPASSWFLFRSENFKSRSTLEALPYINSGSAGNYEYTNPPSDANSTNGFSTSAPLFVGSRNNMFHFLWAEVAELIIYSRILTASEVSQVEDYLKDKYNL